MVGSAGEAPAGVASTGEVDESFLDEKGRRAFLQRHFGSEHERVTGFGEIALKESCSAGSP
jgi:hypothetical protein